MGVDDDLPNAGFLQFIEGLAVGAEAYLYEYSVQGQVVLGIGGAIAEEHRFIAKIFLIYCRWRCFSIPTYGAALYHQSLFKFGDWRLIAGIRLDLEHTSMDYHSHATIPYCFDLTMTDFKELYSEFKGRERQTFFEVLPKVVVEYDTAIGSVYGSISRGYKAGAPTR